MRENPRPHVPCRTPSLCLSISYISQMHHRQHQYFEDNKLNPKSVWPGVWRMVLVFTCAILSFLATNGFWPSVPLSVRFVTAALFGILQVWYGMVWCGVVWCGVVPLFGTCWLCSIRFFPCGVGCVSGHRRGAVL